MSSAPVQSPCVMDRLRSETRPHHDRAEQSGFGSLVMEGGLTKDLYVVHLAAWRRILAQLEQALRCSDDEVIRAVWDEDLAKVPLLDRDLDALSPGGVTWTDGTAKAVGSFNAMVDRLEREEPRSLLGVVYVLEGSTMGGSVMKPRIAGQLGLEGDHGLAYYGCYGTNVGPHFKAFRSSMADAANGTGAEDRIVEAGKATFDGVSEILRTIASPE